MHFFLAVIFLTFCTYHLNGQEAADIELIAPSQDGIDYKIQWPETLTPEMIRRMESVSMLLENKLRLPGSIGGLMKRIEKDKALLEKTLYSFGYYGCKVDVKIDLEKAPVVIHFTCDLGPLYTIEHMQLENRGKSPMPELTVNLDDLVGLSKGDALIAEHAKKSQIVINFRHLTNSKVIHVQKLFLKAYARTSFYSYICMFYQKN